jgi:DNA-binding NtrC family response regulator
VIEREDHEVIAFEDAAPALEEVNWEEIDLVVSDLVMLTLVVNLF